MVRSRHAQRGTEGDRRGGVCLPLKSTLGFGAEEDGPGTRGVQLLSTEGVYSRDIGRGNSREWGGASLRGAVEVPHEDEEIRPAEDADPLRPAPRSAAAAAAAAAGFSAGAGAASAAGPLPSQCPRRAAACRPPGPWRIRDRASSVPTPPPRGRRARVTPSDHDGRLRVEPQRLREREPRVLKRHQVPVARRAPCAAPSQGGVRAGTVRGRVGERRGERGARVGRGPRARRVGRKFWGRNGG